MKEVSNETRELVSSGGEDVFEEPPETSNGSSAGENKKKKAREKRAKTKSPEGKKLYGVRVSSLLLVCYIASFLGWWVENIFRIFSIGVFNDRHQILPFLAAYGFGIFVLYFVFGTPSEMRVFKKRILPENTRRNRILRVVIYYALVFVLILFGEMGVGLLFETLLGIRAWNYTNIPLHITRYTSIPTTFGFTTGITLLMQFVFRPFVRRVERIPQKTAFRLALVFGILIAADWLIMLGTGLFTNSLPNYWEIVFW